MYAQQINVNDQGIYYAINRKTGGINNVFQLVYEYDNWYLYQLKTIDQQGDVAWVKLAPDDDGDGALNPVDAQTAEAYFYKPEYLEPKGHWQILKNSRYGFGKFTPESQEMGIHFGLIIFSENNMLTPLLIEKAKDEALQSLAELAR